MDGIASTKKIRYTLQREFGLKRQDQPIIIGITGHVESSFRKEGQKAGMDDILPKPLYKNMLKATLEKYGLL